MTPAAEKLREYLRSIYAPIDRRSVVEWCEDEITLSERQTQSPGNFSTRLTPYLRDPLECFGDVDVLLRLVLPGQLGHPLQPGAQHRALGRLLAHAREALELLLHVLERLLGEAGCVDRLLQLLDLDRKSTRLNSSHVSESRMPSSA